MKKHTVDLTRAKKLKKLGWEKKTYWSWVKNPNAREHHVMDVQNPEGHTNLLAAGYDLCPAPIAAEIFEELPGYKKGYHQISLYFEFGKVGVDIARPEGLAHGVWTQYADTPANALADMWIYLKKEKLI